MYFVICFNKPSNIYIYILNLYFVAWVMAWWYSPCLGPCNFKKVICSNPPMGPSTLNLTWGLPMALLGWVYYCALKKKKLNSFHHMLHWMKIEWWGMNSIDEPEIKLHAYHEFFLFSNILWIIIITKQIME